jgi:DNA-binding transcriptional ArsR family regulator
MSSVQSVERAFTVLRCLAGGPAGVSQIADRVGLPKSTVSRLLSTLQMLGAVEQVSAGGAYRVGETIVALASAALPGRSLADIARPHVQDLVTAGLAGGVPRKVCRRVLRGGSWNNNRHNARCSYRNNNHPDNRNNNIGFRVLCSSHITAALRSHLAVPSGGWRKMPPALSADHGLRAQGWVARWRGAIPSARSSGRRAHTE